MKNRLTQIIEYKTSGAQKPFADLMGWSQPYLHRMLNGTGGIGLTPVVTVLQNLPEIDARWLLLGEGNMFVADNKYVNVLGHVLALAALEKYIPYMTPEEQHALASGITSFPEHRITEWENLLRAHDTFINNHFPDYAQS